MQESEFIQWTHDCRAGLKQAMSKSKFRTGNFVVKPERKIAAAFEDILKSLEVNFIFQLRRDGQYGYHIYW